MQQRQPASGPGSAPKRRSQPLPMPTARPASRWSASLSPPHRRYRNSPPQPAANLPHHRPGASGSGGRDTPDPARTPAHRPAPAAEKSGSRSASRSGGIKQSPPKPTRRPQRPAQPPEGRPAGPTVTHRSGPPHSAPGGRTTLRSSACRLPGAALGQPLPTRSRLHQQQRFRHPGPPSAPAEPLSPLCCVRVQPPLTTPTAP